MVFVRQCHSGGSFTGDINIDGVPASINAGDAYQLTVTVTNQISIFQSGFQIVALNSSNEMQTTSQPFHRFIGKKHQLLKIPGSYAFHFPFNGLGELTWTVTWTSPATGSGGLLWRIGSCQRQW